MMIPTEIRQRAIDLVESLPGDKLPQVVEFLETLSGDQAAQPVSIGTAEAELLHIINQRLLPEEQARLAYLRQRNEMGSITEAEHQELLVLIDRVENQDAERAAALIQLAQFRHVDLKNLINEFLPNTQQS
jgi:hypothetical protein